MGTLLFFCGWGVGGDVCDVAQQAVLEADAVLSKRGAEWEMAYVAHLLARRVGVCQGLGRV